MGLCYKYTGVRRADQTEWRLNLLQVHSHTEYYSCSHSAKYRCDALCTMSMYTLVDSESMNRVV